MTTSLAAPLRLRLLRMFDRLFAPLPQARMNPAEQTERELVKASQSMGTYLERFDHRDLDILDYGCGWGGETLWLAHQVRSVVGVDIDAGAVEQAERARLDHGIQNCRFVRATDGRIPIEDCRFDAVFSTDTFEHVLDLDRAFREIFRVLRPGGVLVTRFGPLFYSPFGYHLRWACQVPYAHLIFGLESILTLRNERDRNVCHARTWEDTGLNRRRFSEFRAAAVHAGFYLRRFDRIPVRGFRPLLVVPGIRDLVTFGIDCVATRPHQAEAIRAH